MTVASLQPPLVVEVTRGPMVESSHRCHAAVVDADGGLVEAHGEADRLVFPRSAIKALQALPLIETGAADQFGLTDAELALACSSHGGEAAHVAAAASMLAKAGRDTGVLECGSHWPLNQRAAHDLAISGGHPLALHNNCSGKHAGFVCLACANDIDPRGYVARTHQVQRWVAEAVSDVTGADLGEDAVCGTDGCSIPTYAIALSKLGHGFARFATGHGVGTERAKAMARLRSAVAAEPFMVAGTGRFCTNVMRAFGSRIFAKTGAEGVFCVALPSVGLGIAVKCEDGATRAAEGMTAHLIARHLPMSEQERAGFERYLAPELVNWRGTAVGRVRVAT